VSIWPVLIQFLARITFGVAMSMSLTSSRLVTTGFFRVHLLVLLGVSTVTSLALYTHGQSLGYSQWALTMAIATVVVSYVGAVAWVYQNQRIGKLMIATVAALGLSTALVCTNWEMTNPWQRGYVTFDLFNSSMVIGLTMTAMFLGHWYLNTPTMQLQPLRRLVLLMAIALVLRAIVGSGALVVELQSHSHIMSWWLMLGFRWISGILGAGVLAVMTWQTLRIPNTQSATGILYAAVILTFLGELTSQLLSRDGQFPL